MERNLVVYRLARFALLVVAKIWFRVQAIGSQELPKGGVVLAPNHASHLDPVLVGITVRRPLFFLARHSLFRPRSWGKILRMVGAVPIDREALSKESFTKTIRELRAGNSTLIFPEGTRSSDGQLLELKPGVIQLSQIARVPVVPVWIQGSLEALPRHSKFPRPKKIRVKFGRPLDCTKREIDTCLNELKNELLALQADLDKSGRNPVRSVAAL